MKIILTGASGFLGTYIYNQLIKNNEIYTISRSSAAINADLAKEIPKLPLANLVIHCAGKAHSVPKTEKEKQAFFDVNLTGTSNLLKALENSSELPSGFVFISTVAVYGREFGTMINENHPLRATDPYGVSKVQAEQLIKNWCAKNEVICTILRLPLLVGKTPPGNLGAMLKGIEKGYYFNIGRGGAKKSMVLAEDVAMLIPVVAKVGGIYNLSDGYHPSFSELSAKMAGKLNKPKPSNIPIWVAKMIATVGDLLGSTAPINTNKIRKITSDLTFDDSKARKMLNWNPRPVLESFYISEQT